MPRRNSRGAVNAIVQGRQGDTLFGQAADSKRWPPWASTFAIVHFAKYVVARF